VSTLALSTHTGTHCDAPWHFEDGGKTLDQVDTRVFFGDALVIDLPHVDIIRADDLPPRPLPPRVLFKSRNSAAPHDTPFRKNYVALDRCAAQRCVDDGVRLVGVDYLSVAPYKQDGQNTHHILLRADVFVVEGLLLREIPPGTYPFVVLPMHVAGADGAPCRAFVGAEDNGG
ncbi:MAG: cyclase family protein, partial [Candidatus Hydrogenedentes bacterium]|nr:cyclase family protein [Candidatus Hydrogenedentota bacterium]